MTLSKNLKSYLDAADRSTFARALMMQFAIDAKERNPDVASEKMLKQLAQPKYNAAIKAINEELESLKIMNRRKDV